ncbi:hypothetical protein ACFVTP_33115 [Streptomyces celluloflavus]|uniref:hypothetical protein n=1 Tax=Streptomyces celluloflavus TaxID=58344 RepID=UPI0036D9B421
MRIGNVEVGETYTANIPQRLPAEMRDRPVTTPAEWQADMQLHLARGRRITVTVTGYGDEPGTVAVSREIPAGRVGLRLTAEQAAALGLAEGQEYEIDGTVTDGTGRVITFPTTVTHTIPARWLRPRGERLELDPDTVRLHRAEVCRAADGMTPQEIDQAIAEALETVHRVQGMALDDPDADRSVLTAEADYQEWLRISRRAEASNLTAYDPRNDPDAVEYPPLIRFRER